MNFALSHVQTSDRVFMALSPHAKCPSEQGPSCIHVLGRATLSAAACAYHKKFFPATDEFDGLHRLAAAACALIPKRLAGFAKLLWLQFGRNVGEDQPSYLRPSAANARATPAAVLPLAHPIPVA